VEKEDDKLLCSNCPFGRRCDHKPTGGFNFKGLTAEESISVSCCPRYHLQQHGLVLQDPFFWYSKLELGILPEAGGYIAQANIFVECMNILTQLVCETRLQYRLKNQQRADNSAKAGHVHY